MDDLMKASEGPWVKPTPEQEQIVRSALNLSPNTQVMVRPSLDCDTTSIMYKATRYGYSPNDVTKVVLPPMQVDPLFLLDKDLYDQVWRAREKTFQEEAKRQTDAVRFVFTL